MRDLNSSSRPARGTPPPRERSDAVGFAPLSPPPPQGAKPQDGRQALVVTELPYMMVKGRLVEQLLQDLDAGTLQGVEGQAGRAPAPSGTTSPPQAPHNACTGETAAFARNETLKDGC